MTFLCFSSLTRSLPDELKSAVIIKEHGPTIPARMNVALNHSNFQRVVYDTLIEKKLCAIKRKQKKKRKKWMRDMGCFETGSTTVVMKATKSATIIMFHYKLVNRIIAANTYLKMIKVKDDDMTRTMTRTMCTFCRRETETLSHIYWYCPQVQSFIDSIRAGLLNEYHISLNINVAHSPHQPFK